MVQFHGVFLFLHNWRLKFTSAGWSSLESWLSGLRLESRGDDQIQRRAPPSWADGAGSYHVPETNLTLAFKSSFSKFFFFNVKGIWKLLLNIIFGLSCAVKNERPAVFHVVGGSGAGQGDTARERGGKTDGGCALQRGGQRRCPSRHQAS